MLVDIKTSKNTITLEIEVLENKKYKYFEELSGIEFNNLDKETFEYILNSLPGSKDTKVLSINIYNTKD